MPLSWELEWSDDGDIWHKLGVQAAGGFVPYRYETKPEAEKALILYCDKPYRRAVPSTSVTNGM
jgi:hypothetical protein